MKTVISRRDELDSQLTTLRSQIEANMMRIRMTMAECHLNESFTQRDAAEVEFRKLIVEANELQAQFQNALKAWSELAAA